jgi:hypothetical protein
MFASPPMRSREYVDHLRKQAARCRRLAAQITSASVADDLAALAGEYEARAYGHEQQMQAGDGSDDQQQQG